VVYTIFIFMDIGHFSNPKQGWTSFNFLVLVLLGFKSGYCRYSMVWKSTILVGKKQHERVLSIIRNTVLSGGKKLRGTGKKGHSAGAAISGLILLLLVTRDLSPDKCTHSSVNYMTISSRRRRRISFFNYDDNKRIQLTSNIHVATTRLMKGCRLECEWAI